ncbi:ArsR/SmtB family transcription factor [Sulfurirhabdus autotrophica]|uniref:ArsR family transcriptional regulator n=1 Tax=Sulfurirhabdus autotrophica TaxID=1706046 RepID=A0A4R3XQB9_9PROT|nr:metalloregulator ArsR/SmtB family transcription factor [Sulfurirhabdus autotrophica]TCV77494.1 ArsR family transcriptional regulator [Sulfurirhabdus autotrophica]
MHLINIQPQEVFQSLADQTRVRIMRLLAVTGEETCLCELVDSLLEPQYKLSKHLKIIRQAGLLTSEKEGRWVYHRLVQGIQFLETLYQVLKELPDNNGIYTADLARFRERMCLREDGRCRVGSQNTELTTGGE